MHLRQLGGTQLQVPPVVFGAWAIGGWQWGGSDDDAAIRAIQAGIEAGISAIDTAPVYGFGHSETVVGRALAGRRDKVVLMTKVGLRWDDTRGTKYFETLDQNGVARQIYKNSRPWSVIEEVEHSLVRLKTDRIDLIQIHRDDPSTPIEETMGALAQLVEQGKVRAVGTSNFGVKLLEQARAGLRALPLASEQAKYSLVARELEREVLPWCRAHEVGILAYSPLEQGLLTGKVGAQRGFPDSDARHKRGTFTPENRARVNAVLERVVKPIAQQHQATLAQTVIAWTVAQPGVTCALVGARTEEQARENARGGEIVLSAEELAAIRGAFEALKLAGVAGASPGLKGFVKKLLGR